MDLQNSWEELSPHFRVKGISQNLSKTVKGENSQEDNGDGKKDQMGVELHTGPTVVGEGSPTA